MIESISIEVSERKIIFIQGSTRWWSVCFLFVGNTIFRCFYAFWCNVWSSVWYLNVIHTNEKQKMHLSSSAATFGENWKFHPKMAWDETLLYHHSSRISSSGTSCFTEIHQTNETLFPSNPKLRSGQSERKSHGLNKFIRINLVKTMNACAKFLCQSLHSCETSHSEAKTVNPLVRRQVHEWQSAQQNVGSIWIREISLSGELYWIM